MHVISLAYYGEVVMAFSPKHMRFKRSIRTSIVCGWCGCTNLYFEAKIQICKQGK